MLIVDSPTLKDGLLPQAATPFALRPAGPTLARQYLRALRVLFDAGVGSLRRQHSGGNFEGNLSRNRSGVFPSLYSKPLELSASYSKKYPQI